MIQVYSDYSDYYDKALKGVELNGTLIRKKNGLSSKAEQMKILRSFGLATPLHGKPSEVMSELKAMGKEELESAEVIVWPEKDDGRKPIKTNLSHALKYYSDSFITEYIITSDRSNVGQCIRCLYLGKYVICYKVTNELLDDSEQWRSGIAVADSILRVHEGQAEIIEQNEEEDMKALNGLNTMFPIYFCDLVHNDNESIAVNFNPAPVLRNTPVELIADPEDMAALIENSLKLSYEVCRH